MLRENKSLQMSFAKSLVETGAIELCSGVFGEIENVREI
jgi:hypothetical protein